MAQENSNTPDTTEEVQATAEEQGTPDTEAAPALNTPALNRAQRRAQARGKTGSGGANAPAAHGGGGRPAGRPGGPAVPVRFPRTGHK
ncbi:MAG: hypothetical protein JO250_19955 [Armatimonadetes bacterium]|nr:hypothetical protein [Armatimonadota bacterium]